MVAHCLWGEFCNDFTWCGGTRAGPTPDAELKALQGTWVAESEELNGVATPKEKLDRTLAVEGTTRRTRSGGEPGFTRRVKLVLDPSKAPRAMDVVGKDFERKAIDARDWCRVVNPDELQSVTPGAKTKTHFVIVDAVGAREQDKSASKLLDRQSTIPFDKILDTVAKGVADPDLASTLAAVWSASTAS